MDAHQLADAVARVQYERNRLRDLMVAVLDSVTESRPDGSGFAHLPAWLLDEIRNQLGR